MRISVGQFGPVGDVEENLAVMARLAARAAGEGADLLAVSYTHLRAHET